MRQQKVKDDREYGICEEQRLYECLQLRNGDLTVWYGRKERNILLFFFSFVDENWNGENTTDSSDNGAELLADERQKRMRYGEFVMYATCENEKRKHIQFEEENGKRAKVKSIRVLGWSVRSNFAVFPAQDNNDTKWLLLFCPHRSRTCEYREKHRKRSKNSKLHRIRMEMIRKRKNFPLNWIYSVDSRWKTQYTAERLIFIRLMAYSIWHLQRAFQMVGNNSSGGFTQLCPRSCMADCWFVV